MRGHNHPRSTHIYDDGEMCPTGRCTYRPTATILGACSWELSYVLYQCPDDRPKTSLPVTLLYDTYALLNSNYCFTVGLVPHSMLNYTALLVRTTSK